MKHIHTNRLDRLLCTRDLSGAGSSAWHRSTFTTDRHPCSRQDSNPKSLKASGRRPFP